MDLFEHEARDLFEKHGVPVPRGRVAADPAEARAAAAALGGPVVVKAQVKTGGRGKAGGVRVVHTADDAEQAADDILG
ncbi:ATP-grasp domain-containing protein, partial [Amycolatopsis lexingtonensis]